MNATPFKKSLKSVFARSLQPWQHTDRGFAFVTVTKQSIQPKSHTSKKTNLPLTSTVALEQDEQIQTKRV